jgi:hypothetical protein
MRTLLLVGVFFVCACKKDEKKAPEPTEQAKPPEPADAAPAPPEPPDAPPIDAAPPAPVKIANASEFEAKSLEIRKGVLAVFDAAGKECDKVAADLNKFVDDNQPLIDALSAFGKANPAAKKAFDKKMKPRQKELEKKVMPAMDACPDHKGLEGAIERLPG